MQYIKIKMPLDKDGIKYPSGYNNIENFIKDHLFVDINGEDANKKKIKKVFLCLSIKEGVDYKVILGDLDRIEEMTLEHMIKFCEPHEEKKECITDEAKIKRLAIKAQLQRPFTAEEDAAIDPENDEVLGFGLTKRFVDRIQED